MEKAIKLILILLVGVWLTSCKTLSYENCLQAYPHPPPQVDSVLVIQKVEVLKDTTITIILPGEVVKDSTQPVIKQGLINMPRRHLYTQYTKAWVEIVNGVLRWELEQREVEIQKTISNAIREYKENHTTIIKEEIPFPVAIPLTWWQQTWIKAGQILSTVMLVLIVLVVGWIILKFKVPFLK